ncbi:LysE family translocator [Novosphingobium profundi]|uniref:LysE family translocator n=1 Tax=Novosphingobium profundi TaxID=1774954 RepID=UPI001BD9389B|nr:LysE family translocator [Novosphingobium profundi]MBT0667818.1 LysE family translocator [Novosphingobium profundi]
MTLAHWWLFAVATCLLSATPGPNMLHALTRSVEVGFRRALAAAAGCLLAVLCLLSAPAVGLSTLLHAVPGAFTLLRYAGGAYLLYLGFKAWRAPASTTLDDVAMPGRSVSPGSLARGGFAVGISNPKAILFAAAFLPQFVDPMLPQAPQFAILVATSCAFEAMWLMIYAAGGRSIARFLSRGQVKKAFNRLTGSLFAAFGLALLANR